MKFDRTLIEMRLTNNTLYETSYFNLEKKEENEAAQFWHCKVLQDSWN